jgi:molybdopterin-binding protein
VIVQLSLGSVLLLAEVTHDAIDRLRITVGCQLYALVKSVSINIVGVDSVDSDVLSGRPSASDTASS